jgi:hypothetical protein
MQEVLIEIARYVSLSLSALAILDRDMDAVSQRERERRSGGDDARRA